MKHRQREDYLNNRASGRRPPTDDEIRENVEAHLRHGLNHDIVVEVNDGTVTLIGEVPHSVMKHEMAEMAMSCPGVRRVDNRLNVLLTAPWPEKPPASA